LSKKLQKVQRNDKKLQKVHAFYKKIPKNTNFSPFFCRKCAENLPLYAKPKPKKVVHYISIYAYTYILFSKPRKTLLLTSLPE